MPLNKTRHSVACTSAILMALVVAAILFPASVVRAQGGQDSPAARTMFRTKCAVCHAQDGSGNTDVGKSLKVPDLRSEAVQKRPNSELAQVISNGKGGMPSFKNSLSEEQTHAVVAHIRSLHQKK